MNYSLSALNGPQDYLKIKTPVRESRSSGSGGIRSKWRPPTAPLPARAVAAPLPARAVVAPLPARSVAASSTGLTAEQLRRLLAEQTHDTEMRLKLERERIAASQLKTDAESAAARRRAESQQDMMRMLIMSDMEKTVVEAQPIMAPASSAGFAPAREIADSPAQAIPGAAIIRAREHEEIVDNGHESVKSKAPILIMAGLGALGLLFYLNR